MTETIATLMHRGVQAVGIDDSVASVESFLREKALTWVPVTDDQGTVIGVISCSDLLLFHAQQRDAADVPAWQLCSYKPVVVGPQASLPEVAREMVQRRIHHVVVADREQVLGVVSAMDFVAHCARAGSAMDPAGR
jgi:CBS domain-containing protein